ncbi:hypothetical protein [Thalassospira lucentensis]|uniref:hypothetical protein n=1 Tax=Thalassospira lucentensis TaxID=168935 RepID=UPI003D280430
MWSSRFEQAIPIIGSCFGGFICGVIARNGFVDWTGETLVAGFLGLAGGLLAYLAATAQQRAIEKRNSFSFGVRTHQNRTLATRAIQELMEARNHSKLYQRANDFINITSPIMEEILTGNDPLESHLAQLVAKTSHQFIEARETIQFAIEARNYRKAEWDKAILQEFKKPMAESRDIVMEVDIEAEAKAILISIKILAEYLYMIDDHFKFHHDTHPRSSS